MYVSYVYRYPRAHTATDWDSITKEDLEFSVGSKQGVWSIKEPLLDHMEDDQNYGTSNAYGYPPNKAAY